MCRPYKGGRNLILYPTRATARVAPTTFPHRYTERRAGSSRPTGGAEPSGSPQEPVPDRPAGSRLTFRDTAGGASPSPTVLKKLFRDWVGEALGPPAVDDSAKRSPSSAPFVGTCPYPLCRCATSSLPLLAFGHFPLTGGIVPLIRGVAPLGGGRLGRLIAAPTASTEAVSHFVGAGPRPARNYGPAITCSAKPGAVVEPHQRKFLQTQGPVARKEFRCPLRFCAPEILLHLSGTRPP